MVENGGVAADLTSITWTLSDGITWSDGSALTLADVVFTWQYCTEANFEPICTAPFVVTEFRPNDVITMAANENYRVPDQPAFASVVFKGGGDAASAARSVLETGEFDYAWNLQIDPTILAEMESNGIGTVVTAFGTSVERLMLNQFDPAASLGDARSTEEAGPPPPDLFPRGGWPAKKPDF